MEIKKPWWHKFFVWIFIGLPPPGVIIAIIASYFWGFSWIGIFLCLGFCFISILGINIGFHRGATHHGFEAKPAVWAFLGICGSLALEGSIFSWVADHRTHHQYSDKEGDPHSPHLHGDDFWGMLHGAWHAHVGWILGEGAMTNQDIVGDLKKNPVLCFVDRFFILWVIISVLLPVLLGGLISWSWYGALQGFLWGTLARIAIVHHVTWSINSVCHMVGTQPFQHLTKRKDKSRNFWPLWLIAAGENFHSNHHVFPGSARHGIRWWEFDISWYVILIFEKLGWISEVKRPEI